MSYDRHQVTGSLRAEEVYRALQVLDSDHADALVLRIFGGLSTVEAAQVMGISETVIKRLVCQAVRDLREQLARQSEAEP